MTSASTRAATTARLNPAVSVSAADRTRYQSRRVAPNARLRMAPYSGPTTIAPTMRICELVKIPTAPISPAMTSSANQLGGNVPSSSIRASTSAQTGVKASNRPRRATARSACPLIDASTFSSTIEPRWPIPSSRSRPMTSSAAPCRTSKCTASPSGWLTAPGRTIRFSTAGSALSRGRRAPVTSGGLTTRR